MNHRYLYLITHSCGHLASYKRMEPFTKAEYYQQRALVCPSCQAEAEAKARVAAPEEPPEPVLGRSAIWKRNRRSCEGCGKSASLREYDGRQLCQACYRKAGGMDGKAGICKKCGKMRQRWYVNGRMICRECQSQSPFG